MCTTSCRHGPYTPAAKLPGSEAMNLKSIFQNLFSAVALILCCALFVGCADDSDDTAIPPAPTDDTTTDAIEVAGVFDDNYGGWVVIDGAVWGQTAIIQYDNAENWVVTQNAADAEYSPSAFSLTVWTEPDADGKWYQCTVAYGLATLEEALAAEDISDDSDPLNSGCGDFGWTEMTPREAIEVVGTWADNYGGSTLITASMWGDQHITDYDNTDNWTITQNASDAEYSPSAFNKVVWTEAVDGVWYHCMVAYGFETADEAMAAEDTSDDTDPLNSGCGDFGWTEMTAGS